LEKYLGIVHTQAKTQEQKEERNMTLFVNKAGDKRYE